jgi:hypothetical protein
MVATSGTRVVSPVAVMSRRVPAIGSEKVGAVCAAAPCGAAAAPSASAAIKARFIGKSLVVA